MDGRESVRGIRRRTAGGRCTVRSATLVGVEAIAVSVEVVLANGIPGFSIVGMPDAAVQESRERVRAAIKACGFSVPADKIVVNLAPSSLRKSGSGFDLPIALGLLAASGQADAKAFADALVVGELSLDGSVRGIRGTLSYEMRAREEGIRLICARDSPDLLPLEGLEIAPIEHLGDIRSGLPSALPLRAKAPAAALPDYSEVGGNEAAKRALQIAAAGNHGVLMVGPPGSGKTMLASRLPSILPDLRDEEAIEAARVWSVAGEDTVAVAAGRRPFRAPHHSISMAGLVGGGNPLKPGEISLAHRGVLFLDELPEFRPAALQALRQPMEQGTVLLVRADAAVMFPARFMLVAAMNPCPCGYLGDPDIACTCGVEQVNRYRSRIGGPLLDRIDIQLDVWRTEFDQVVHAGSGVSSAELREGVMRAREFASWRTERYPEEPGGDAMGRYAVEEDAEAFLRTASEMVKMSGRGIIRTLGIARTIADMAQSERIERVHMAEALSLRLREGGG